MKHVAGEVILLSAERLPVLEIAKRVGIRRPMVWRWQQRFAEEGIEGLLRDKTRPPGIPPAPQAKVHAVVTRTGANRPVQSPIGSDGSAQGGGLSCDHAQLISAAHQLEPHRMRTFSFANPDFAATR